MDIEVNWERIRGSRDPNWDQSRCLYAYCGPTSPHIHYIGMTYDMDIAGRWHGEHKDGVFERMYRSAGLSEIDVVVLSGYIDLEPGRNLSEQLLCDIESLLIHELQPCGNVRSTRTRNRGRRDMTVMCTGDWPITQKEFQDPGVPVRRRA